MPSSFSSSIAGYEGFSAMLYSALILFLYRLSLTDDRLHWIPAVSLTVALFRPDGAIVGTAFTLACLPYAYRAGILHRYLRIALVAGMVGISYFIWRYIYFGHLLPLPLYVKSVGSVVAYYELIPGLTVPYFQGLPKSLQVSCLTSCRKGSRRSPYDKQRLTIE